MSLLVWQSDEDEENYEEVRRMIESSIREQIAKRFAASGNFREGRTVAAGIGGGTGQCRRKGCDQPQTVDRLSGLPFEYCSLECLRRDRAGLPAGNTPEKRRSKLCFVCIRRY